MLKGLIHLKMQLSRLPSKEIKAEKLKLRAKPVSVL